MGNHRLARIIAVQGASLKWEPCGQPKAEIPGLCCLIDQKTQSLIPASDIGGVKSYRFLVFAMHSIQSGFGMGKIIPVVLAAGDSTRMGYPKALLPVGPDTFLTRILKTLGTIQLGRPCVVLGTHSGLILPLLEGWDTKVILNPAPRRGMGSSLRVAVESIETSGAGCLVWPVDHPLVPPALVQELITLFLASAAPIALPRCIDQAGHPAVFGSSLIKEILAAPPDESPKAVVMRHRRNTAWLDTGDRTTIDDIDTPADYAKIFGETPETAWLRRYGLE